jgi:hypothetical protein
MTYILGHLARAGRDATRRAFSCSVLAGAVFSILGAGPSTAQTAPGDWTGQSLSTALMAPDGALYNEVFAQSYTTLAGPNCWGPSGAVLSLTACTPVQTAAGDSTVASNIAYFGTHTPASSIPAAASAPGSLAVVNVQGEYADPSSPTGVSYINASIPLNQFAMASSVSAETARATSVEARLATAIQAETDARVAAINDVTRSYRMATATAIALSGVGLVPGKRFNLTMNMGTYEGQVSVAAQGAVVVGQHVVLNAGVSTSATGGGTGARAGVTLGW